jgi:SAM-dependent methyltransferase
MSFEVAGSAYDRFIGRYSREIAPRFLAFAGVAEGPVLDVGCGPGGLTAVLAARFGASGVAAVDPSQSFVAACRERVPGADVRLASGEALPFERGAFGGALAQLVLSFVREPDRMAAEMARVVRRGGVVATCTFEAGGFTLARAFWEAALRVDPRAPDDARLPFRRAAELTDLLDRAGLRQIATGVLEVEVEYADFEDCWSPLTFGIGPTGGYLAGQPEDRRRAIREAMFEILGTPAGPFRAGARVLAVRGVA